MRTYSVLQFFEFGHLPEHLRETARPFHALAWSLARKETDHPSQVAVALTKLLEAKDAAVRSRLPLNLDLTPPEPPPFPPVLREEVEGSDNGDGP